MHQFLGWGMGLLTPELGTLWGMRMWLPTRLHGYLKLCYCQPWHRLSAVPAQVHSFREGPHPSRSQRPPHLRESNSSDHTGRHRAHTIYAHINANNINITCFIPCFSKFSIRTWPFTCLYSLFLELCYNEIVTPVLHIVQTVRVFIY